MLSSYIFPICKKCLKVEIHNHWTKLDSIIEDYLTTKSFTYIETLCYECLRDEREEEKRNFERRMGR